MRFFNYISKDLLAVALLAMPIVLLSPADIVAADGSSVQAKPVPRKRSPKSKLRRLTSFFGENFNVEDQFDGEVIDVTDEAPPAVEAVPQAKPQEPTPQSPPPSAEVPKASAKLPENRKPNIDYVSNDPTAHPVLPLTETPSVRVNPDAPSPIKGMVSAYRSGDRVMAEGYADQFIRYQQNFLFEVREYTQLIGEALIRQKVIESDDWMGVGQYLNYEFAKARQEQKALFKPTHDVALDRIKPDAEGKVAIYYFFTLNCSYCRVMAPDVERLWQLAKNDPNIQMVGLTLGPIPKEWLEEYRKYTGWTLPVYSGEEMAKNFNVGFVPAIVAVAPNGQRAYLKTGQQDFGRMYQFVRKVQGLPMTLSPEIEQLIDTPIGDIELAAAAKEAKTNPKLATRMRKLKRGQLVRPKKVSSTFKMERF